MSDRLTDENGKLNVPVYREHIRGVKAKTLKAVAEWGAETCTKDELHLTGDKLQERNRTDCPLCMANLWEAVSDGKMPGEE